LPIADPAVCLESKEMSPRYRTIVADPPWEIGEFPRHEWGSGPNPVPYPCMTLAEIGALPVSEFAAPEAHLYSKNQSSEGRRNREHLSSAKAAVPPGPEDVARLFHETYERLAPDFGYETRRESAVPWEDVPEQNKRLMVAVAAEILVVLARVAPVPEGEV